MENNQNFNPLKPDEIQNMLDSFESDENDILKIPLMFITDPQFKDLSSDAKILYSLLLHRTGLSPKNGWIDQNNHTYVIYTIEQIMKDLNCWQNKAIKAMRELKDIGLVKSVRRGQGKADLIYVTHFANVCRKT